MSATAARPHRQKAQRDEDATAFTRILDDLLDAVPLGVGTVIVDSEGEAVDYVGYIDTYDMKVAAAYLNVVLSDIANSAFELFPQRLIIRASQRAYFVRRIQNEYALVVISHPRVVFAVSERAVLEAQRHICAEAGWDFSGRKWSRVKVKTRPGKRKRPVALRACGHAAKTAPDWVSLEVLGAMVGLAKRERGYRVRLVTGAELNLVREPGGAWFADETLDVAAERDATAQTRP